LPLLRPTRKPYRLPAVHGDWSRLVIAAAPLFHSVEGMN